jgi:hypothetical protein
MEFPELTFLRRIEQRLAYGVMDESIARVTSDLDKLRSKGFRERRFDLSALGRRDLAEHTRINGHAEHRCGDQDPASDGIE